MGVAQARRWQASFAKVVAVLRAYTDLAHKEVPSKVWSRARALSPDSLETSYLDTVEFWLISVSSMNDLESPYDVRLYARLLQAEPSERWEPLFLFLRGYALLETNRAAGREAAEVAWTAAARVPHLLARYGRQWSCLQGRLSLVIADAGSSRLVASEGREGLQDLERAYRMGGAALLGPRDQEPLPPLAEATGTLAARFLMQEREGAHAVALALLGTGRVEASLALASSLRKGSSLAVLVEAEALLLKGEAEAACRLLEPLSGTDLSQMAHYWGALAHARALGGDMQGAQAALRQSEATPAPERKVYGFPWHAPDRVPALLSGSGWWPGRPAESR